MSSELVGLIGLAVMLVLVLSRVWVGTAMAIVGIGGYALLEGWGKALDLAGSEPYAQSASYILAAVPMFIFMGLVICHTGLGADLYQAASLWVGRIRGGLAMASVVAAGVFAAVCGDSVATATTIGKVAYPEMRKYGYDTRLATGCLAAGGTVGIMIPPSLGFIIYGLLTEQSIGKLFIAGILPGILQVGLYTLTIALLCRLRPDWAPAAISKTLPWREKVAGSRNALGVAAIILFVIGGIYLGVFTPTEAGALGSFGALLVSLLLRKLNRTTLTRAVTEGAQVAGMVAFMVISVFMFNRFMAVSHAPNALTDLVTGLGFSPMVVLLGVIALYLVLGCFMEVFAAIMLTLPFVYPTITALGFDPIWFGVLVVRLMEIGLITPPVGLNCYVFAGTIEVPVTTVFRGIAPFLLADAVHVAILIAWPDLALYLVR